MLTMNNVFDLPKPLKIRHSIIFY